jgi:hypothetical protein
MGQNPYLILLAEQPWGSRLQPVARVLLREEAAPADVHEDDTLLFKGEARLPPVAHMTLHAGRVTLDIFEARHEAWLRALFAGLPPRDLPPIPDAPDLGLRYPGAVLLYWDDPGPESGEAAEEVVQPWEPRIVERLARALRGRRSGWVIAAGPARSGLLMGLAPPPTGLLPPITDLLFRRPAARSSMRSAQTNRRQEAMGVLSILSLVFGGLLIFFGAVALATFGQMYLGWWVGCLALGGLLTGLGWWGFRWYRRKVPRHRGSRQPLPNSGGIERSS